MLLRLLQVSVIGVFLGRAWQHLYWDAPYRALLWDENWMRGPVSFFLRMEWSEYVSSHRVDQGIQWLIQGTGFFYVLCAAAALLITRFPKICRFLLTLGGISLIFLAFLYTKERFYWWPQFFEYSLQWGCPFLLLAYYRRGAPPKFVWWAKVAVALTFTSHGLFAMGVYPTPGYFIEMVIYILRFDQANAVLFLKIAGIMDLIISFLLFLPWQWMVLAGLGYAAAWGFATTIARVWAYSIILSWDQVLLQWLHESVMRAPHFLVPLFLLLLLYGRHLAPAPGGNRE
jgi:hypothetical protein